MRLSAVLISAALADAYVANLTYPGAAPRFQGGAHVLIALAPVFEFVRHGRRN